MSPFSARGPAAVLAVAMTLAPQAVAAGHAWPGTAGAAAGQRASARRACPVSRSEAVMSCMTLVRTRQGRREEPALPGQPPAGFGYGPAQLERAYRLPSRSAGAGESVAVVDAYDDPAAAADLAAYRSAWGLPGCLPRTGAGCLTKVNQKGAAGPLPRPAGVTGWATEESVDLDMVSAICPACHIYLVEASSPGAASLGAAVNAAVRVLHVRFVSNSYGGSPGPADRRYDVRYYRHPGVAVVAAGGDSGYRLSYPAASPYVVSVGGTRLTMARWTTRGWQESAWDGTGSGCAWREPRPSWQHAMGCTGRSDNDVAAVADPGTGVAVYDTYDQFGWLEVGGTSVAAPIITAAFALAGRPKPGSYPARHLYAHPRGFYDVTAGSDGTCRLRYLCTARKGYDGPTGLGTPRGIGAFRS